jgi:ribonuclease BN (tRNA processing enzyme)
MHLTIVGCGDAFGAGGRSHTCFRLHSHGRTLLVDFGASAVTGYSRLNITTSDIDAVLVSHLHGDHFGGVPFLLLARQFIEKEPRRDLLILGPPGTESRLLTSIENLFPGSLNLDWNFTWAVRELEPGQESEVAGFRVRTTAVIHDSGAPSTGVRVWTEESSFAYSGDTEWTEALVPLAEGADVFVVECSASERASRGHLDWSTLKGKLPALKASRVIITHMGPSALAIQSSFSAVGVLVAHDGLVVEF